MVLGRRLVSQTDVFPRITRILGALGLAWMAATSVALAQVPAAGAAAASGTVFDVRPGDTFSGIAAQVTGSPALWRKLYHPQKSGLPNPDLIHVGARFELVREADGTSYLRLLGAGKAVPAAPAVAAAEPKARPAPRPAEPARVPETLTIGVLPNIPAPALMEQNEPLKVYLERINRNKVNVVTAPNFRAFFESTMKGEYDVAVIAANLGRVAQLDGGLVPIAIYEPRIRALLIGLKEQGITSAKDLKGKSLVFQNPQSLVAMYAQPWLRRQGLESGKDFDVKSVRTDIGVGRMLLTGEAAGAIMSGGEFRQIPAAEADRLAIVEQIAEVPNFVVLAHPRLGAGFIRDLAYQLRTFPADTIDGAAFSQRTGVAKIADADDKQMAELDPYVDQTRRAMGLVK